MKTSSLTELTQWIRRTFQKTPERVKIRTRHIEKDRIWREISEADVRKALGNGKVTSTRISDRTVFWRGKDIDGRELELQIGIENAAGTDVLVVRDAAICRVGTAYIPTQDDRLVKIEWLKNHPEYEELPDGSVKKRVRTYEVP